MVVDETVDNAAIGATQDVNGLVVRAFDAVA
jgi:hypothetical protein